VLQIRLNRITPALPAAPSRRPRRFLRGALRVLCAVVLVLAIFGIWVTQPVWVRRGPSTPAADPARLQAHVRMLAETLVPRSSSDAANLGRCAAYIGAQLAAAGAQVSTQRYAAGEQQFENVIGQFGPAAGACVVIGAHYDAWSHLPGADDNASGVAGLLELARLLGRGAPPRAPVTLVACAAPSGAGACRRRSRERAWLAPRPTRRGAPPSRSHLHVFLDHALWRAEAGTPVLPLLLARRCRHPHQKSKLCGSAVLRFTSPFPLMGGPYTVGRIK
jgi:hypothetical protein